MTWGELKKQIQDLGFEDDSAMEEYSSIVRNAVNHAINIINTTVVMPLSAYFRAQDPDWVLPEITDITEDTEGDFKIQLPSIVCPLVKLLSAHYVWLDDDLTKATYYYNEYDDLMNQIKQACYATTKVTIGKGLRL